MKLLIVLLLIFAAVISLGFWINHSLNVQANNLIKEIRQIEREIENNRWDTAYTKTVSFERSWDKKAGWWPTILDHCEMDEIKFAIARTKEYVAEKNPVLANGQLSELELMIKNIPDKEVVKIKNIL